MLTSPLLHHKGQRRGKRKLIWPQRLSSGAEVSLGPCTHSTAVHKGEDEKEKVTKSTYLVASASGSINATHSCASPRSDSHILGLSSPPSTHQRRHWEGLIERWISRERGVIRVRGFLTNFGLVQGQQPSSHASQSADRIRAASPDLNASCLASCRA